MIVGRDCDGKPLYVGDRVRVVNPKVKTRYIGRETTILGVVSGFGPDKLEVDLPAPGGVGFAWAYPRSLQKISRDDKSDWTETEKATGWKPVRECA